MQKKTCSKCKKQKDIEEFFRLKTGEEKRRSNCKKCDNIRNKKAVKKYRQSEKGIEKRRARQRSEKHKERVKKYLSNPKALKLTRASKAKWEKNNKIKKRAHAAIREMIKKGTIQRSKKCSKCGLKGKIEGHHKDYNKPKEYIWICKACHTAIHWNL